MSGVRVMQNPLRGNRFPGFELLRYKGGPGRMLAHPVVPGPNHLRSGCDRLYAYPLRNATGAI